MITPEMVVEASAVDIYVASTVMDSLEEAQAPAVQSDEDELVCCICLQGASDRDPLVPADGCKCGNAKGGHKSTHHA